MSKNQQGIFWATVALAMVVISFWVIKLQYPSHALAGTVAVIRAVQSKNTANISNNAEAASVPVPTTTPAVASTSTPPAAANPTYRRKTIPKTPMPSYGDMVTKYQNTRIQFGPDCQAHPNQIAIGNPVTFMLDNRSSLEQKITVGKAVYNVAAYNYVIATVDEKILPVNLFINCNQSVNVVEIFLQK